MLADQFIDQLAIDGIVLGAAGEKSLAVFVDR
jgi:hypothetical protein